MTFDMKVALWEKLGNCGMYRAVDDFMASEACAERSDLPQPFWILLSPKGLTFVTADKEMRELGKHTFADAGVPDMPSELVREFMVLVIEHCKEHHPEFDYRYRQRRLLDSEKNAAEAAQQKREAEAAARDDSAVARGAPAPRSPRPGFGFQNPRGGDFSGTAPGRGGAQLRIRNTPGGDYGAGPRRTGLARPEAERVSAAEALNIGYTIAVLQKSEAPAVPAAPETPFEKPLDDAARKRQQQ